MSGFMQPLTPDPSPTQAGRGETTRAVLVSLPEFGESGGRVG